MSEILEEEFNGNDHEMDDDEEEEFITPQEVS